jgi:hypothetical protein
MYGHLKKEAREFKTRHFIMEPSVDYGILEFRDRKHIQKMATH